MLVPSAISTIFAAAAAAEAPSPIWIQIPGFVVGALIAILAEPLRRRIFRPKLRLCFENGPDCIAPTPFTNSQSGMVVGNGVYTRVRVTNESYFTAKNCRVYLINVEELDAASGLFKTAIQGDSLQLAWACRPNPANKFAALDLLRGVNQYVDVFHTDDRRPTIFVPDIEFHPAGYLDLVDKSCTYRLTILATGDDVAAARGKLILKWDRQWNNFMVSPDLASST